MNDSMHDIVKRLAVLEGRITPTYPSGSQNPQQKSVHQLPALFKPGKGGPILGGDPDKPAVTKGYLVGADESEEKEKEKALEEAVATEEKLLDKVKKSFIDYLDSVEDAVAKNKDRDIGDRAADKGISKKAKDQGIVAKDKTVDEEQLDEFLPALGAAAARALVGTEAGALTRGVASLAGRAAGTAIQNKLSNDEVNEDPTQSEPPPDTAVAPIQEPTYAAQPSAPVKTVTLEDGRICEIHGNEHTGFEIRHGNRRLPSRFKNLDHAVMATEMWQARQRSQRESADYIDEA